MRITVPRVVTVALAVAVLVTGCSGSEPNPVPLPTVQADATPFVQPDRAGCADRPSACGWPDETNTGVPAGTALTVHNGDLTVTEPGYVVDGLEIHGCVNVRAENVTIRRTRILCDSWWGITSFPDEHNGGLLVEDVEIDCLGRPASTALGYALLVARRVNLHNCENGVDIDHDVTILDSFIHDMAEDEEGHADGIQFGGPGGNVVIRHNTIRMPIGTSAIITGRGGQFHDITIEANLLIGGIYTLYCPEEPGSVDVRLIDNRFGRDSVYGPWVDCHAIDDKRGNIWDDTLEPLSDDD